MKKINSTVFKVWKTRKLQKAFDKELFLEEKVLNKNIQKNEEKMKQKKLLKEMKENIER